MTGSIVAILRCFPESGPIVASRASALASWMLKAGPPRAKLVCTVCTLKSMLPTLSFCAFLLMSPTYSFPTCAPSLPEEPDWLAMFGSLDEFWVLSAAV